MLLAADFVTKQIALTHFSGSDPTEALGGLVKFTLVFNLADCGVVCGSALVMWASMRGIRLNGTRESDAPAEAGAMERTAEGRDR
ncbi:hypothetical protein ACFWJ4_38030 [Kitasatospora sp. NPDC127067]|uniref:hypothetical protein n=1 Tax=Kitasatospora sp. NPDC127067 TaxID=3347126 RepID=UPI00365256E6